MHDKTQGSVHWLLRPDTIRLMWRWGLAALAAIALLDLVVAAHPAFGVDGLFGFYSFYGFATCAAMVLLAKALGYFLKRKDTYYDE